MNQTLQNNNTNKNNQTQVSTKKIKFLKLLKFSNVHADFYLINITRKYAIIINCNVLSNEIKHKYFFILLSHFRCFFC